MRKSPTTILDAKVDESAEKTPQTLRYQFGKGVRYQFGSQQLAALRTPIAPLSR
jgi:hypothetical protein